MSCIKRLTTLFTVLILLLLFIFALSACAQKYDAEKQEFLKIWNETVVDRERNVASVIVKRNIFSSFSPYYTDKATINSVLDLFAELNAKRLVLEPPEAVELWDSEEGNYTEFVSVATDDKIFITVTADNYGNTMVILVDNGNKYTFYTSKGLTADEIINSY